MNLPAYTIVLVVFLGTLVNSVFKIIYAVPDIQAKEAIQIWVLTCFFPVLVPCVLAIGCGALVTLIDTNSGWFRLGAVVLIHTLILSVSAWMLGLRQLEKEKLQYYVRRTLAFKQTK